MNSSDITHFASLERKLSGYLEEHNCRGLDNLDKFPFDTLADVNKAYKLGIITFTVPYHADGIFSFGTKNQRLISILISLSLLGNILGNIALAVLNQEWIFILGALLAVIGFLLSTPYNRLLPLLIGVSAIILCYSFFKDNIEWISLSGSFLAGILYSKILRAIYKLAIIKRALYSEPMLCYLLIKRMILMVEPETETVFNQLPSIP